MDAKSKETFGIKKQLIIPRSNFCLFSPFLAVVLICCSQSTKYESDAGEMDSGASETHEELLLSLATNYVTEEGDMFSVMSEENIGAKEAAYLDQTAWGRMYTSKENHGVAGDESGYLLDSYSFDEYGLLPTFDNNSFEVLFEKEDPRSREKMIESMKRYLESTHKNHPSPPAQEKRRKWKHYQSFKDFIIKSLAINRMDAIGIALRVKEDLSLWQKIIVIKERRVKQGGKTVFFPDTISAYDAIQAHFDSLVVAHNAFIQKMQDALQNSGSFRTSPVTSKAFEQDLDVLFSKKNRLVDFIIKTLDNNEANASNAHRTLIQQRFQNFALTSLQDSTNKEAPNGKHDNKKEPFEKFRVVLELGKNTTDFITNNLKGVIDYCKENVNKIKLARKNNIVNEFQVCRMDTFDRM